MFKDFTIYKILNTSKFEEPIEGKNIITVSLIFFNAVNSLILREINLGKYLNIYYSSQNSCYI